MKERDRDREEMIRKLKESFAGIPAGRMLSVELIAERREEARREEARMSDVEDRQDRDRMEGTAGEQAQLLSELRRVARRRGRRRGPLR